MEGYEINVDGVEKISVIYLFIQNLNDIETHLRKLRRRKNICNACLLNHAAC